MGLTPTRVGEADTGVLPVPPPELLELPTIAVGVEPAPVVGEPPPQAATMRSRLNNTKLKQIAG